MTLADFLLDHAPLTGVELLPDERLINVVIGDGQLFGVNVEDIPPDAHITRVAGWLDDQTITAKDGLTFDTTEYTMLGMDAPPVDPVV